MSTKENILPLLKPSLVGKEEAKLSQLIEKNEETQITPLIHSFCYYLFLTCSPTCIIFHSFIFLFLFYLINQRIKPSVI